MLNTISFTVLISATPFAGIAQTITQIDGKVVDRNDDPVPFANAILYRALDTTIVQGVVANNLGSFSLNEINKGNYILGFRSLGFIPYYSESFELGNDSTLHLGTIVLSEDSYELDEIVVAAKRNLTQTTSFGKVINVQSSVMTRGSNALQVLERLPGVLMDRRNNLFSLNGQNGVTVMFNGRRVPLSMEEVMALLEGTLADTIEKIELITSPSAKYEADGGAGIINIIFKKNQYEGNQLNVSTSMGYSVREKASASLQYAYGKNKISVNSSYSISHDRNKNGFEGSGTSNIPALGGPSFGYFSTYFNNNNNNHNLGLDLTYQLRPKVEIGTALTYSFSRNTSEANIDNGRFVENEDFLRSKLVSNSTTRKDNLIFSSYLGSELSENSRLNVDFSYFTYTNDRPAITTSQYFNEQGDEVIPENEIFTSGNRGQSFSSLRFVVLKADYSLRLNEKLESEFGIKASYANNENDSKIETNNNGVWEVDPRSQSLISSDEKLWAAYSQLKFLLSENATLHAGLRYENWNRTMANRDNAFVIKQFFPSLSYQHEWSENLGVKVNYHKRVSRPAYSDLVTSLYYNDPIAVFTGNPLLKPAITNTIQADFNMSAFTVGLSYQKETNPILRYQFVSSPQHDILIISPQNADYQKSINLFLNLPLQWANWAELNVSSTSSYRRYRISYIPIPAEKSYFYQTLNFNQRFKLPFAIDMEFSGWYNFPSYNGSHITKGFGIMNFGLAKKLKNDRGTVQLSIADIFKSFQVYTHNGGMAPVVFDINTNSRYRDESAFSRVFRITYARSFGSMTGKKTSNIRRSEELERVN
jgi:hypothetical protein